MTKAEKRVKNMLGIQIKHSEEKVSELKSLFLNLDIPVDLSGFIDKARKEDKILSKYGVDRQNYISSIVEEESVIEVLNSLIRSII